MTSQPAPNPSTAEPAVEPAFDCAAELKQRFPALFTGAPKPLKLRIQADIQQRAPGVFSKQALSAFFRRYTGSTGYLIALTRSQQRFNLDGEPDGELSEEHREIARQELARRRERQAERRHAEEQQRRDRAQLLRDFERTTLTPANFCALKGIAPEQLDALLAQAREEAREAPRLAPAGAPRGRAQRTDRADRTERPQRPQRPQGRRS